MITMRRMMRMMLLIMMDILQHRHLPKRGLKTNSLSKRYAKSYLHCRPWCQRMCNFAIYPMDECAAIFWAHRHRHGKQRCCLWTSIYYSMTNSNSCCSRLVAPELVVVMSTTPVPIVPTAALDHPQLTCPRFIMAPCLDPGMCKPLSRYISILCNFFRGFLC